MMIFYFIFRNTNRYFITYIEIKDPDITVKYNDRTGQHVIYGSKYNVRFKKESLRYSSELKVIVDGKVLIKQYEIGDWTDFDMMAILVAQNPELGLKHN